jgi:hypothetical protein
MALSANDEKLSRLTDKFGLEGYGFWWRIVEIVAEKVDAGAGTSVEFSMKKWRSLIGIPPKKFQILAEFCSNLGLFSAKFEQNYITIDLPNILKFRDEYSDKKQKKSGQCPDNCRDTVGTLLTDTDTETETEEKIHPPTPRRGEIVVSAPPVPSPEPKTESPKATAGKSRNPKPPGNSVQELRAAGEAFTTSHQLRTTLEDFRVMRERIRKPLTGRALELLLAQLDKLAPDDAGKIAVLEQSIVNSWQGLFPLREVSPQPARASPIVKSFAELQSERNMAEFQKLRAQKMRQQAGNENNHV